MNLVPTATTPAPKNAFELLMRVDLYKNL